MVFGASFGWGMLVVAPVLFCWQGSIYLVAKFLSASFFTGPLVTEISIVGGFLIACSGLALLKIRDVKTLNFLRSEERRVGKDGVSWCGPNHSKQNTRYVEHYMNDE